MITSPSGALNYGYYTHFKMHGFNPWHEKIWIRHFDHP